MSRTALQRVQWHPLDGCPVALWHLSSGSEVFIVGLQFAYVEAYQRSRSAP